jgi:hypothetical protein
VLAAPTVNVLDASVRPPFCPARVNTSPLAISGTPGAVLEARLVSRVVPSGRAAPPTVVSTWLVRMLAPEPTGPLALRLPSIIACVVARATVVVPSGIVMLFSCPGATFPSASTPYPCTNSPDDVTSWFSELSENDPSRV